MKEQQLYSADTIILFVGDFFNVKKLNFSFNHLMYEISFSVLSYLVSKDTQKLYSSRTLTFRQKNKKKKKKNNAY